MCPSHLLYLLMRMSGGRITCSQPACQPQCPQYSSSLPDASSHPCCCPWSPQQKITVTSAQLGHIRVQAKDLILEALKVSSCLLPDWASSHTLSCTLSPKPHRKSAWISLIKSVLNGVCGPLSPLAKPSAKTQSTGTYWNMWWDAGSFQEDIFWPPHIYLRMITLITIVFQPLAHVTQGMQKWYQHISIFLCTSAHLMAIRKHSYM